jgi:hypothetical protein
MTDPRNPLPDPGVGRNPPMYREPDAERGIASGVILSIAVAAMVAVGALWYSYSMSGPSTTATHPPTTTTGQGNPRVTAPVIDNVTPAPVPAPAPQAAPATTPGPATPTNIDPKP